MIGGIALDSASANFLTWLALIAVPPLAAIALGWIVHGARPWLGLAAIPLFAVAWAAKGELGGQSCALALSALACVTLGWLLVCVVPARWVKLGIYAMAIVDAYLVFTELLQEPNSVLNAAAPAADLPKLQLVSWGSALMGFGDLFIAAVLGALLARDRRPPAPRRPPGGAPLLRLGPPLLRDQDDPGDRPHRPDPADPGALGPITASQKCVANSVMSAPKPANIIVQTAISAVTIVC